MQWRWVSLTKCSFDGWDNEVQLRLLERIKQPRFENSKPAGDYSLTLWTCFEDTTSFYFKGFRSSWRGNLMFIWYSVGMLNVNNQGQRPRLNHALNLFPVITLVLPSNKPTEAQSFMTSCMVPIAEECGLVRSPGDILANGTSRPLTSKQNFLWRSTSSLGIRILWTEKRLEPNVNSLLKSTPLVTKILR